MTTQIKAVYERGLLRPLKTLALQEGETVEIVLVQRRASASRSSPAQLLAAIASLPDQPRTDAFSNRAHDNALYGERGEE
jgi:predicted DNA-binding antitoxin AbrB/MazE fold protein